MTAIAGISRAGQVFIGADSAGVGGYSLTVRADDKVFRVDEFVIGGSTTRMNKLEFGEYCEAIRQWAAMELGINIPDPGEYEAA